jgi:hypothetical protein
MMTARLNIMIVIRLLVKFMVRVFVLVQLPFCGLDDDNAIIREIQIWHTQTRFGFENEPAISRY